MSITNIKSENNETIYYYFNNNLILYVEKIVGDKKILVQLTRKQKYKLLKQNPGHYITNEDSFREKIKEDDKYKHILKYFEYKLRDFKLIPEPRTKRLCFHDPNGVKFTNYSLWTDHFNYLSLKLVRIQLKELRKIKYNPNNIEEENGCKVGDDQKYC